LQSEVQTKEFVPALFRKPEMIHPRIVEIKYLRGYKEL